MKQNRKSSICRRIQTPIFYISFAFLFLFVLQHSTTAQSKWVGTWSCAPYAAGTNTPPSPYLANNTLRQIVRVSIGGDTLRVKFSNITSSTPVTMKSVNIAVSTNGSTSIIDASTQKELTFNGSSSVTMDSYSEITSDPIAYTLTPNMRLAITTYYGECETASDMTFHYGSRTDSYILQGDKTTSEDFAEATSVERWYHIASIDVLAPSKSASVAVLGNSITDGYGLHGGLKNKWTDAFSENMLSYSASSHISVLNLGIGATWLTTSGVSRFQQDVLTQAGLRWVIIFYGVNDIGGNASADDIINAYKTLIEQAHMRNVSVYGATITPFKGSGYYSEEHESTRIEVNEWIRTPGNFDKLLDFEKVVRDPEDTTRLLPAYSNDWLHPNAIGYKVLGESVDINLFLKDDTITYREPDTTRLESHYLEAECGPVGTNWEIKENAGASNTGFISAKEGKESLDATSIKTENVVQYNFTITNDSNYYLYVRINCPTANNDSYWIKMDNGNYEMYNNLGTSGWQWMQLQGYNLTQGDHSLSISIREDGAMLDKLCISNFEFAPFGLGNSAENSCTPDFTSENVDTADTKVNELLKTSYQYTNFPNPFNEKIHFANLDNINTITILDIAGNRMIQRKTHGKNGITLKTSHLKKGFYMATLDGDFGTSSLKLIKN